MTRRVLAFSLAAALAAPLAACKQGAGENCQVNDDCSDGLICNASTRECQERGAAVDAGQEIDAAEPDATPPDAATPDAAPPDAAP